MYDDMYTVLESLAWLFRISGCYPFSLQGTRKYRKYALSTISVTFNVVFFIVSAKYFHDFSKIVKNAYDFDENPLAVLMLAALHFTSLACIFDASIMKIIHSRKFISSIDALSLQDQILKTMGYCLNYKLTVKVSALVIPLYLLIVYTLLNTEFFVFDVPIPLPFRIFGNFAVLVKMINIVLFLFLVFNMGQRFKGLNVCILKILNNDYKKLGPPISDKTPMEYLQTAAKMHAKLCKIGKAINSVYYITLIVTTLGSFVFSTALTFYIFILSKYGFEQVGFRILFVFFSLLFVQVITVIKIVLVCNWTSAQIRNTEKILYNISLSDMCIADKSLNKMVYYFSMQILHHNFGFTAAGLFPINSTLIQSLAGAITTYLVILIQFNPKT